MLYNLYPSGMDIKRSISLIILTVSLVFGCVQRQADSNGDVVRDPAVGSVEQLPTITVEALQQLMNSAGTATFILDVRTPAEYDGPLGHIEGARLIPVNELPQRIDELSDVKDQTIYVICRSGGRSARAARILIEAGFRAVNVAGGMRAWGNLVGKQAEPVENPE